MRTGKGVPANLLQEVLDALEDCAYALDREWRLVAFNAAAEAHYALAREEALGRVVWEALPAVAGGPFESCARRVMRGREAEEFVAPSTVRAGVDVRIRVVPSPSGVVVTVRNVTAERAVEQALSDAQRRLALAAEASRIGVWEWDVQTGAIHFDVRMREMFGFMPARSLTVEDWRNAAHPEDLPLMQAIAAHALDPAVRAREAYEYRIVRPGDGELRWILAHGEAIFSQGEAPRALRYVGAAQDVTAQKLELARAQDDERRLRLALEAGRMACWAVDLRAEAITGSRELNRLLGFPEDSAPTLDEIRAGYFPGEQERVRGVLQRALASGENSFAVEYRYVRPDGDLRWLLLRSEIIPDEAGAPAEVVGVLADVTEQRQAQERTRMLAMELAHRVKNTLAVIGALAHQSLSAPELKEAREQFMGRVRAIARAHDLLIDAPSEPVGLARLLETILAPYGDEATGRIALGGPDVRVQPSTSLVLVLLFHELATNAAKYGALSQEKGRVELTWSVTPPGSVSTIGFEWRERGGPPVEGARTPGFGTRLIERQLAMAGGSAELMHEPTGLVCRGSIPLPGAPRRR